MKNSLLVLISLSLFGLTSCGVANDACTLIGCSDALVVELHADGERPRPGNYEVELVADGETTTCSFQFLLVCEGGGHCVEPSTSTCPEATFDTARVDPVFSIPVSGTPMSVDYVVRVADEEVASGTVTPEYETVRPNGPDCEPVCQQATARVAVPSDAT